MKSFKQITVLGIILTLTAGNIALAQNASEAKTFTISGNVGVAGVVMQGLPGNPVTDEDGFYSVIVPQGWVGNITPMKEGFSFSPARRQHNPVNRDWPNQNFTAEVVSYTISGSVGIEGVLMTGLPGAPITDTNGRYRAKVPYGFSGIVMPEKDGFVFTPPSREYSAVNEDVDNQDYFAEVQMLTISDTVIMNGTPIPGVQVTASSGATCITDVRGRYSLQVPYGWSGEISLSREGYAFDPPGKPFTNVITNIRDGIPELSGRGRSFYRYDTYRYRRAAATSPSRIAGTAGRRILVVPAVDLEPEELAGTVEDMYIMSNILDERFKEPRMIQGVFRDFGDFFGRDNRETEAVYMQGYGVVFIMEVDYTFTPAQQSQQRTEDETAEGVDPTWQQARERIFSPGAGRISRDGSAGEYDGQMVNELKAELIRTLKHATNIRNLESDEWVILSVTGKSRQSGGMMMGGWSMYGQSSDRTRASSSGRTGGYGGGGMGGYAVSGGYGGGRSGMGAGMGGGSMGGYGGMSEYDQTGVPPVTVLTIRVKKEDIDAFSKGDIDFEQFRQKVQVFTY